MKAKKDRLDNIMHLRGFFPSREKAKAAIMAGVVLVDGVVVIKAGTQVCADADISISENPCPYVSRGGLKLAGALVSFGIDVNGILAIDIGASTGGFTDCLLQNGARKVYAIDVGYGQLDWKLRNDPRVVNLERINIRLLEKHVITESADLITVDVSFISLKLVFPVAAGLLREDGLLISLVKPQFEAGRRQVGKKGIVRDPEVHRDVIKNVIAYGLKNGLFVKNMMASPIDGAKGNREFFLIFGKEAHMDGKRLGDQHPDGQHPDDQHPDGQHPDAPLINDSWIDMVIQEGRL